MHVYISRRLAHNNSRMGSAEHGEGRVAPDRALPTGDPSIRDGGLHPELRHHRTPQNITVDLCIYVPMEVWTYGSEDIDNSAYKNWPEG
jgi:hypothetical protein